MKTLICVIAVLTAVCVRADESGDAAVSAKKPRAGMLVKPGSQKGVFTFVNTQTQLPTSEIENVAKQVERELKIKTAIVRADPAEPSALVGASGGAVGLVIAFDDSTPAILVAPEDGWAVVNLKKVDRFTTPEARAKFFAERCRREIMRGFACVACGTCSSYPGNVMSVTKIDELELAPEGIPNDKVQAAQRFLASRGYSPVKMVPYVVACREGWAPAPTNHAQKVVWDRVRAVPTDPIKIKYDPKLDK